jgi:hypothetical protein
MPSGFEFPDPGTRVWRPLRIPPPPALTIVSAMARLRDGATPAQAADEADRSCARRAYRSRPMPLLGGGSGASGPARDLADSPRDARQ